MAASRAQEPEKLMRELAWSHGEKAVAKKAFDHALQQELGEIVAEFKSRASRVKEAAELWDIEYWLGQRRNEINEKYDYRYSVMPMVLGTLIREGRLKEDELQGLREDKIKYIRRVAGL